MPRSPKRLAGYEATTVRDTRADKPGAIVTKLNGEIVEF